jgi:catechol 2,3-dioxygenase-like lactoylglutathione lyase family enzyme
VTDYVPAGEQLVLEVYVASVAEAGRSYRGFGFEVVRDEGDFMELRWETALLFLDQRPGINALAPAAGNVRIMVSDVDRYWRLAHDLGAVVLNPIGDRGYGLRDFVIAGPGGVGLRFATLLADPA